MAEIFNQMGVNDIELISIAKQEEEIFTLSSPESVKIPRRDYSLRMVQRIRDEAHRFAITYFRNLHSKNILKSELEKIEGVGKQRRIALMDKFSTIDKIMSASAEEIARTPGISLKVARAIKDYFSN